MRSRRARIVKGPRSSVATVAALSAAAVAVLLAAPPAAAQAPSAADLPIDPDKITGAEACGECHVSAFEVWKGTTHQTGFKNLHRKEAAEAIAGRMGFRLLKRDSLCLTCHYTPATQGDELRAVSGVSCESCHGAARDWIDVHNDYGGRGFDHTNEDPAQRTRRIEASRTAGMRRPSDDLYALMASCFGCHTVSNEKLVNVGGHGTGSGDFELVAWTEGEIRHNFLHSFLDGDGTDNVERPMPHRRVLYVLGRALALEHSLRAMAAAQEEGVFAKATSRRIRSALRDVQILHRRLDLPELAAMIATVRGLDVGPNQRAAMLAAAEAIGEQARRFVAGHDGQSLASLDPVLLGTAEPVALADADGAGDAADDTDTVIADAGDGGVTGGAGSGSAGSGSAGSGTTGTGTASPAAATQRTVREAVPAAGTFKRRIRPRSEHPTLGSDACASCHRHQDQAAWWFDDPHYAAADPFFDQRPENVKIATLYGLKRSQLARGDQVCMDCHGTVVSGQERAEVADGVGCEGCHGGAGAYLEPHQAGDAALGTERPGYRQALGLGMAELKDLDVRARVCTGCHYVTEPRLISAGHPSGKGFDYAGGMARIKHWQHAPAPAGAVRTAMSAVLAARGAVPDVVRARLAEVITTAVAGGGTPADVASAVSGDDGVAAAAGAARRRAARPAVPRARPFRVRGSAGRGDAAGTLELPPFPEIDETTAIEAALLLLKQRLELLYDAVGGGASTPEGNR